MNQYQDTNIMSNLSLKERAKGVLAGRFGQAVLAFFLVCAITLGAQFTISFLATFLSTIILITKELATNASSVQDMFKLLSDPSFMNAYTFQINLLEHIFSFGTSILTGVFNVGLSFFCLKLACGRPTGISDIFYGFRNQFAKSLKLAAVYTLVQEIYIFPSTIYLYLYQNNAALPIQYAFLCLTAIGISISAYFLLHISQCFFLLLDFPDRSAGELLRLSSHIMNGHKKRLLFLHLSFLPLFLLSIFTLGIANLWILPYREVACAFFFLNLMQARNHQN